MTLPSSRRIIINKFLSLLYRHREIAQIFTAATLSYITSIIANYASAPTSGTAVVSAGLLVVFFSTLLSVWLGHAIGQEIKKQQRVHDMHKTGYHMLNREVNNYMKMLRSLNGGEFSKEYSGVAHELILNSVSDLYGALDMQFSSETNLEEHIDFETTFMTESLKDGKLTIAGWANRDGRAPKSLARRNDVPDIYEGTETSKLYNDRNHSIRVIENTESAEYKELYPGQLTRIKSSLIFPVMDDRSTLLGTLVVHCDKGNFFQQVDIKFWRELLDPYTKRLAFARLIVSAIHFERNTYQPF